MPVAVPCQALPFQCAGVVSCCCVEKVVAQMSFQAVIENVSHSREPPAFPAACWNQPARLSEPQGSVTVPSHVLYQR